MYVIDFDLKKTKKKTILGQYFKKAMNSVSYLLCPLIKVGVIHVALY